MKIFAITATALLATVDYAAPALVEALSVLVQVDFIGDAGAGFTMFFPRSGAIQPISNPLTVSKIHIPSDYIIFFYGINGRRTTVVGPGTSDVETPTVLTGARIFATRAS